MESELDVDELRKRCYQPGELRGYLRRQVVVFNIPAVPVAQPRATATSIGGHARVYNDLRHPVNAFKANVRIAAKQSYDGPPLAGPLQVDCSFVFPRPKSMIWKTRPMPRVLHSKKPDLDNISKAVFDSLNGLLWVDDSQICGGQFQKLIASGDEQPHVLVRVWKIEE